MKKLYLLITVLIISMSVTAYAERRTVVDEAGYLTATEEIELEAKLDEVSVHCNIDVAVVIVDSLGSKSAMSYADDYYDYNGYGMGINDDGILLLICKEPREYHITTHALAVEMFTESGLDYLENEVVEELRNDNYYEACMEFAETVDEIAYLYYEQGGTPYGDSGMVLNENIILYTVVIAAIIAAIMTKKAYDNMNTARKGTNADIYVKQGSMNITRSNDIFLYSNLVKTKVESSSSSGGGRTHRSSSGRSHGGRGGRY